MNNRAASRALGRKLKAHNNHFGRYVIFGFIAAVINIIVFVVFRRWLRDSIFIANTLAFILSNLASFYFNNKAVFTTNLDNDRKPWKKLIVFFTYRIISLVPDTLIMMVGVSWWRLNPLWVKICDQLLVGIFNYLTTKSVFQKHQHRILNRLRHRQKRPPHR